MSEADAFRPLVPWLEPSEHRGVGVLLQDPAGRVLMQLRDDVPGIAGPGRWCLFGGHVDPGETLLETAVREMAEETGLKIAPDQLIPYVVTRSRPDSNLVYIYRMVMDIKPVDVRVGEGAGFAFMTRAQIERLDMLASFKPVFHQYWHEEFAIGA